jgi:hypothetical protein
MSKFIIVFLISCGPTENSSPDASIPTCASLGAPPDLNCTRDGNCTYNGQACIRKMIDAGVPND